MTDNIRARYAPSPTGLQHIGGVRTALFNWLYARSAGGKFILRLEDTDRTRFSPEFVDNLYDTFKWLGFYWDEGPDKGGGYAPYIQSERTALYQKYAGELLEKGQAYYCFCSQERIEAVRKEREAAHSREQGYDRHCRALDPEEARERALSEAHTVRLKIPLGESTKFNDKLLGAVEWKNEDINPDPVLLKSDGFPTYHLANVVDDHLMKISTVLRAQEWLSSTPLHVILYKSFGWAPPEFCHLPMVMGQDGKKLSKRHGATSIDEFRKQGYLPQALINYIALLGASYEEGRDIWSLDELAAHFSLDKLNKSPGVFDYKKLQWYNAQYIKAMDDGALAGLSLPFCDYLGNNGDEGAEESLSKWKQAMPLIKERVNILSEIPEKLKYLFAEPPAPPPAEFVPKKSNIEEAVRYLKIARGIVEELASLDDAGAEILVKEAAAANNIKLGDFLMPLRVAITGTRISPPLFGSIRILGAKTSAERVDRALCI